MDIENRIRTPIDRKTSRGSGTLLQGLRIIWSAGGARERFFLLSPLIWAVFAIALGAWASFSSQSFDVLMRIFLVAISFVALVDAWWTPVMSASVLRASVGTGLNRSDENAKVLSEYLESLGQRGHWRLGTFISLVYFVMMFGWGILAVHFQQITGIENNVFFIALYIACMVILWGVYRLLPKRFLRLAKRAGYSVQLRMRG